MKLKIMLFILVKLNFTNIHNAQVVNYFGVKAGYVNSGQSFDNDTIDDQTKRKSGFLIGVAADLFNFGGFSISPELIDEFKNILDGSISAGVELNLNYGFAVLVEAVYQTDFTESFSNDFINQRNDAWLINIGMGF